MQQAVQDVRLEPWGEGDLRLLERANAPEMTAYLGGPETVRAGESPRPPSPN
ncbi:MAG TPA: hypothetical protein VGD71_25100 [Kribbella sp.]